MEKINENELADIQNFSLQFHQKDAKQQVFFDKK